MDSELEKVVESGKLTSKSAKQLEQLRPGSFCLHKSWGFGQVAEWNLLLNQVVIDFKTKPKHPMQLVYAAENLTPIPAQHFLARKVKEPDVIKALLKSDPAAVVRNILEGFDGKAALTQISEVLVGDLFTEAEWKRWWTSAKKAMKASGYFSIPTKKSEPIALRSEPVSRADELLTFFNQTRQPKEQAAALDQIIKFHHEFKGPKSQLQPIVEKIENTAAQNQRLHSPLTFELVLGRDDLLARVPELQITRPDLTLERLIAVGRYSGETSLSQRAPGSASVAPCAGRCLDETCLANDGGEQSAPGFSNSEDFRRERQDRRVADITRARRAGTFRQ